MSDDLISRKVLFNELFVRNGKVCPNNDIDNFPINFNVKDVKQTIRNAPTAYDVDKVVQSINEIGKRYCNSVKCDKNCEDCEHGCLMRAIINAVKSGGVAND